jgi:Xaa-Pro aminopeptidase
MMTFPTLIIDEARRAHLAKAKLPGMSLADTEPTTFDPVRLRRERLARVRKMMSDNGYAGCVLLGPFNQRYATGTRNMFGYFLRNSTRYFFIAANGPVVLFDYPGSAHCSEVVETVTESRTSKLVWASITGKDSESAGVFADEIAELVRSYGGGNKRVGIDRCGHSVATALIKRGCDPIDFQEDMIRVRAIKTDDEISCLKLSMISTEEGVHNLRAAIRPGITEQALFARLYSTIIETGGDFIETRLLSSGHRTNPWFNEASDKKVRAGDLIALDTDTIGCFGYYSDFSRTFHCGPGKPSGTQKSLYQMSYDQIQHNISIIKPGLSFREIAERAWEIPEKYRTLRYTSVMHGCGMHGEAPFITHLDRFDKYGSEGALSPNMVLCIESYIGEVDGQDGVKLEEEVVVTPTGVELISRYPFEEDLLGRHF